jgi:hypothetical protein
MADRRRLTVLGLKAAGLNDLPYKLHNDDCNEIKIFCAVIRHCD